MCIASSYFVIKDDGNIEYPFSFEMMTAAIDCEVQKHPAVTRPLQYAQDNLVCIFHQEIPDFSLKFRAKSQKSVVLSLGTVNVTSKKGDPEFRIQVLYKSII